MEKTEICSYTLNNLIKQMEEIKEKPFRAKQIYTWLHKRNVWDFEQMTDLSKDFRNKLNDKFIITQGQIEEKLVSEDKTAKYLFKFRNNSIIESVLMSHSFGKSVCVSSQVGCNMGCVFCYSTQNGKERDLTAGEMLMQVYEISKDCNDRISNVVIMGSGEPLDNYENVLDFIEILSSKEGSDLGKRHITLSTCGMVDKMYDLADEGLQINLAISLHASNDNVRKQIMPIASVYTMDEIIKACDYYVEKTGRRPTYEYALMKGINDDLSYAKELTKKFRGKLCHFNLIPVNEIKGGDFKKPDSKTVEDFAKILNNAGIVTTVRREMGSSISAACGQLKGSYHDSKTK